MQEKRQYGPWARLFVLALLLGLTGWHALPARAQQDVAIPGDADGDRQVTLHDAVLALEVAVGLVPQSSLSSEELQGADVWPVPGSGPNSGLGWGDGRVTVEDAMSILRKVAGLSPDPFPGHTRPDTFTFVQYVFQHSCALPECHDASFQQAGLNLSPAAAYKSLVNAPSAEVSSMARVVPGHPEQSYLYTKLAGSPGIKGQLMPFGTKGLTPDLVNCVRRWILKGAPQDGQPVQASPDVGSVPLVGQDVTLAPPPPGEGFQLQWDFFVPPHQEVQRNYYQKLPIDVPIDVDKVEMALSRGSHHFNIFDSTDPAEDVPDHYEDTFDAVVFQDYDLMVDTQIPDFSWQLPPGVVWHFIPHEQMVFQIHYVNATTQQTPGNMAHVKMNFWYAKPGEAKWHLGALFAQNTKTLLPPHTTDTFHLVCRFPQAVNIVAMTGHYHSRGKTFKVFLWDPKTGDGQKVYESDNWDEPPLVIYNNPIPMLPGRGVDYWATYVNNTDNTIRFGPHVENEEHDNLFLFYYPALPGDHTLYVTG